MQPSRHFGGFHHSLLLAHTSLAAKPPYSLSLLWYLPLRHRAKSIKLGLCFTLPALFPLRYVLRYQILHSAGRTSARTTQHRRPSSLYRHTYHHSTQWSTQRYSRCQIPYCRLCMLTRSRELISKPRNELTYVQANLLPSYPYMLTMSQGV